MGSPLPIRFCEAHTGLHGGSRKTLSCRCEAQRRCTQHREVTHEQLPVASPNAPHSLVAGWLQWEVASFGLIASVPFGFGVRIAVPQSAPCPGQQHSSPTALGGSALCWESEVWCVAPVLLRPGCVSLAKLFPCSEPHFSCLLSGGRWGLLTCEQ